MFSELIAEVTRDFYALQPMDGLTVLTLAVLEGILSVDNSLVLAILVRSLPKEQQKKALAYGIAGAFIFRFFALIFASYLIKFSAFKLIGGAYLLYIAMKHMFFFYKEDAHRLRNGTARSFWKTVAVVELTDIAFAIDSITAAVAMSNNILIIWTGGILGIIFLRFMAGYLVRLLEKLPKLEDLAYQLIFFIGTKLFLDGFGVEITHQTFWLMMGLIIVLGSALVYKDYYQRRDRRKFQHLLMERLERSEVGVEELLSMEHIPRDVIEYLRAKDCIRIQVPNPTGKCRMEDPDSGPK
ncbi:MAG: TerC family protein [Syntrophobacteraceae bacterium]